MISGFVYNNSTRYSIVNPSVKVHNNIDGLDPIIVNLIYY